MKTKKGTLTKIFTIVLSLLMLATCFVACATSADAEGVTYITMRINPEIEMIADENGTIIAANAINDDGETVLCELDLVGMSAQDAGEAFTNEATELGFVEIEGKSSVVYVDAQGENEQISQDIEKKLSDKINSYFDNKGIYGRVAPETLEKYAQNVDSWGVSVGHAKMIIRLLDLYPEMTEEEALSLSVSERLSLIKDNAKSKSLTAELHKEYKEQAKALKEEKYAEIKTLSQRLGEIEELLKDESLTSEEREALTSEYNTKKAQRDELKEQYKSELETLKEEYKQRKEESKASSKNKSKEKRSKTEKALSDHEAKFNKNREKAIQDIRAWRATQG